MNLSRLALRKGLNTFAYETTLRCSSTSRRTGTAKSRSRTVDLRSDRPAGVYETIRHGRDGSIAPQRGSQHSLGLPLIGKTWKFCATGAANGFRLSTRRFVPHRNSCAARVSGGSGERQMSAAKTTFSTSTPYAPRVSINT